MDHDPIIEQLLDRCKGFIEHILHASDLHSVAAASLASFEQMRQVARDILQAKIDLEAQQLQRTDVAPCCQDASARYVHTRTVSPETLFGEVCISVRTFQCGGCGASLRPDDRHLGVPAVGDFVDDVRVLYVPVVAELPQRVANDLVQRCTGVALSSRGAQDLQRWQATHEIQEAAAVADALVAGDGAADVRVEVAMDGVWAYIDGRWQEAKVATILVRRLEAQAEELAARITQVIHEAGWARIPIGEILGDGALWIWTVADAHFPGVRQTLDYYHLSEHLHAFATFQHPNNPAGGQGLGGAETRGAAHGPRRGRLECAQADAALENGRLRCAGLADRLRGVEPDPDQVPGAMTPWSGRGVRRGRGGVQACHSQSVQASGYALEAARLSQRLGVAAR
jgi:hypothetical protein